MITNSNTKRHCPDCNDIIVYKCHRFVILANKKQTLCNKCKFKGNKNPFYGKHHSATSIKKMLNNMPNMSGENHPMYGRHHSDKSREKMRISQSKVWRVGNPIYSIKKSEETKKILREKRKLQVITKDDRRKMREAALRRIDKQGTQISFNPNACEYFNVLNEKHAWNLQHALNGGEIRMIGYSLDAYDKNKNTVVEYDEPHHFNKDGTLKEKDVQRMNQLVEHLNCKFYRYNESTKELKQYS